MVAHFIMRTYGVNQAIRFVEDIWLHVNSRQIRFFFSEKTYFASYVRNMILAVVFQNRIGNANPVQNQ